MTVPWSDKNLPVALTSRVVEGVTGICNEKRGVAVAAMAISKASRGAVAMRFAAQFITHTKSLKKVGGIGIEVHGCYLAPEPSLGDVDTPLFNGEHEDMVCWLRVAHISVLVLDFPLCTNPHILQCSQPAYSTNMLPPSPLCIVLYHSYYPEHVLSNIPLHASIRHSLLEFCISHISASHSLLHFSQMFLITFIR